MPMLYFTQENMVKPRVFFTDEIPPVTTRNMGLMIPATQHFKAMNTPKDKPVYICRIFQENLIHASIYDTLQDAVKALLAQASKWTGTCFLKAEEVRPFIDRIKANGDQPTHLSQYRHISSEFFPLDGDLLTVCPVYKR